MKGSLTPALNLVEGITTGVVTNLTHEDLEVLQESKEECLRKVLPMLALEVTQIQAGEEWDGKKLEWSLKIAAFFQEPRAFPWLCQLHRHADAIVEKLGTSFITLYWSTLLYSTVDTEWERLKEEIEDPEVDQIFHLACFSVFPRLVAEGLLSREWVVEYFQEVYKKIFAGETVDPLYSIGLVEATLDLWPGEFMEELREIFGLDLIDDEVLSLEEVLSCHAKGKANMLAEVREWNEMRHPLEPLTEEGFLFGELLQRLNEEKEREEETVIDPEEEAFGGLVRCCRQGKKEQINVCETGKETMPRPDLEGFSLRERRLYYSLVSLVQTQPDQAIEVASLLLSQHPDVPALYEYIRTAYQAMDMKVHAMRMLKEIRERFPSYLLGKLAYAEYLLRREEPKRVKALFDGQFTLGGLCPDREIFYVMEWIKLSHISAWYFLQTGAKEKAKLYLELLRDVSPHSPERHKVEQLWSAAVETE